MGFRERPEYQEWRDAVTRLLGRKCIRCGYSGNIHIHHIRDVNTYPELAFDPSNGVPLCGNCHSEVKGNEAAYVDEFKHLQRLALGGESTGSSEECAHAEREREKREYFERRKKEVALRLKRERFERWGFEPEEPPEKKE